MSIVCGIDFSAEAQRMAQIAARIAVNLDLPLVLVHVVEELALVDEALASADYAPQREGLRALASGLAAGGHAIACELRAGAPGFVLPQVAVEHAASLLIVAERAHSTLARWLFGSTAAQVAAHPPVPVLFVRQPDPLAAWLDRQRPLRVLAAITRDQSARAVVAQLDALRRAGPLTTVIAQVVDATAEHQRLGLPAPGGDDQLHPDATLTLLRDLTKVAGETLEPSAEWRVIASRERVHAAIVHAAETGNADLIVLGCGRAGAWRGTHWGSGVAAGVLAAARANVLCVPPASVAPRVPDLRTVLVAIDGAPDEDRAIGYGYALAAPGGTVHLAMAIPPPHGTGFIARAGEHDLAGEPADRPDLHRHLLDRAPAEARDRAIATRTHVLYGEDPAEAILTLARRLSADVLCVTAGQSGWLKAGLTGDRLAGRSLIPVLLIRPP